MKPIAFKIYLIATIFFFLFTCHIFAESTLSDETIAKGQLLDINGRDFDYSTDLSQYNHKLIFNEKTINLSKWSRTDTWKNSKTGRNLKIKKVKSQPIYSQSEDTYKPNTDSWLTSPAIQLPELTYSSSMIKLQFKESFELESGYDIGHVKISDDKGKSWKILDSRTGRCDTRIREIDLGSYAGKEILIAFNLTSDENYNYGGWSIGDLEVILYEPQSLSAVMTSLNPQNFPFIYSHVAVDYFGSSIGTLTYSNFKVYENNIPQTDYFQVIPPTQSGNSRRTDIVFIMDNSGSMSDEQNAVKNNVLNFVTKLNNTGIDFALGLCRYGYNSNSGYPILENYGQLTEDANYFKNTLWNLNESHGNFEPGYTAIKKSATDFSFRPGTQKVFIIITDENPSQGSVTLQDALSICQQNSITLFALTISGLYSSFEPLTTQTNGNIYDIYSNFDDILNYIASQVSNNYLIRYYSSNPIPDGVERFVDVKINYNGYQATASGSYIPNSAPRITRTNGTKNLHNQAWAEHTQFTISAYIEDQVSPYVNRAQVFFKNSNSSTYQSVYMTNVSGSLWQATIPTSSATTPGLDYYITATDGQATSSDPSVEPGSNPYQIAILPNYAPVIVHTPPSTYSIGVSVPINASVEDNTNYLDKVNLYYRKVGELIYSGTTMNQSGGNNYSATIPSSYATLQGIDYFIKARDNFGVSSLHGTADQPHTINATETGNISRIEISGPSQVRENSTANYICMAYYADGTSKNVTTSVSWSENSSDADIDENGLLETDWVTFDTPIKIFANYGGKSDEHNVLIKNAPKTPTPVLISPANYSTNIDLMPKLEWSSIEGATHWLAVADNKTFAHPVFNITGMKSMFFNVPAWKLQPNTKYYWRVLARKDGMPSSWPNAFYFFTADKIDTNRLFISNLMPNTYEAVYLEEGEPAYVDRDYLVDYIPDDLKHLLWIRTANDDKKSSVTPLISFTLLRKAKIYIAYDCRVTTRPNWLTSLFTQTSYEIKCTDMSIDHFEVWTRDLNPGIVQIDGNLSGGAEGARANYLVLLQPVLADPPVADFDADPKSGNKPLTVQFQDKSQGEITQWDWDFGDGNSSSLQNPVHTYNNNGIYNVSLVVTGPGGTDHKKLNDFIDVHDAAPIANFGANPTYGERPLTVQFSDSSTGQITSWLWDFGDGNSSTKQNPVHIYNSSGTFDVSLTVFDSGGSNTITKDNLITVNDEIIYNTWIPINNGITNLYVRSIAIDYSNSNIIYIGTNDGVYKTTNGGNYWYQSSSALSNINIGDLSLNKTNPLNIYAGSNNGVLKSTDGGSNWISINNGLPTLNVPAVISNYDSILYAGPDGYGIYKSINGGMGWNKVGQGKDIRSFAIDPHNSQIAYATTVQSVLKTINNGNNWVYSGTNLPSPYLVGLAINPKNSSMVYTGPSQSGLWISKNQGQSWFSSNEGLPSSPSINSIAVDPISPNNVFVGTSVNGVYISEDDGMSWSNFNQGLTNLQININALAIDPNYPNIIYVGTNGGGIFKLIRNDGIYADFIADVTEGLCPLQVQFTDQSQGNITTWLWEFGDVNGSTEQNPVHTYDKTDTFTVTLTVVGPGGTDSKTRQDYIKVKEPAPVANFGVDVHKGKCPLTVQFSDSSTGLITSRLWDFGDGDGSTEQNPAHTYQQADSFTVSLTVAGPGGINTKTVKNCICVADPLGITAMYDAAIPDKFQLYQNYPNPFNPSTTIQFGIPKTSHVELLIYNVSGQVIDNLVSQSLSPGSYRYTWEAAGFPSGVYFYKITAGDFVDIKKMIFLK